MLNLKNTLDGYLKNVEVIGNTIQDTNNLADIRSVGDKVEGQELYKIDVVSCGKNLFDGRLQYGTWHTSTGSLATSTQGNICNVEHIRIKPNTSYKLGRNVNLDVWVLWYDINKNYISHSFYTRMQTPSNAYYMCFYLVNGANTYSIDDVKLQIEEGTQATPYEPYKGDKLEILSPVQLEKVGNVADRIICKDGVWGVEKYIETVLFNGSENWRIDTNGTFYMSSAEWKGVPHKPNCVCITDIFSSAISTNDVNDKMFMGNTYLFMIKPSGVVSVDEWKSYLSANNLKVKFVTTRPQFMTLPHDQQVKLRTFAGQTNVFFNTEIAGQVKAQVPKSLGAVVNTHTEQIADLHNSLERVKKLEETTVSTIETESSFTTVDATSNGYFEDVKLEGKTLVNVLRLGGNWFEQETTLQTDSTVAIGLSNHAKSRDLSLLKSNTVYTVIPFVEYTVIKKGMLYLQLTAEINGVQNAIFRLNEDMFNKPVRITINELTNKRTHSLFIGGANCEYKFKDVKILMLEGDHTNNPPEYFEGLLSVGQDVEEVSVASCDFIDITEFESGGFNGEGYPVENGARVRTSNYIPYANTKLKLGMLGSQEAEIVFYNKDKTKLSNIAWVKDGDIVAVPNNTQYVRVALRYPNDVVIYPSDIKYFKMSCPKDKKPLLYYNPTTETWEKPILREWDTIEKHSDGKYYYHKRSGEVVLNGNESWVFTNTWNSDGETIGFHLNDKTSNGKDSICDRFNLLTSKEGNIAFIDKECFCFPLSAWLGIRIAKSKLPTQDVAGFKAWLKTNPTTVVYQLAQEEIYECTNIDLMTYSGETNYIVNSGAISPKSLLKVHNNISNVVKILQEKVSLLENTFIAGLKSVLSGDMYSLATILYPEDFEQNDNTEQDIMVIPE